MIIVDLSSSRGVSPAIGTILMVAVVVVLAATISVFALGFLNDLNQPAPMVAQSSGDLVYDRPGSNDQIVRLTHVAGDDLAVSELEIVVDATDACGKESRIVSLPTNTLGSANYNGDDIFAYYSPDGGQLDTSADGTWSAGGTATFRIASSECEINEGDTITIRVVHTPTNSVIIKETLTAT
ncbi:type IV pilin [Salarchaeum sp. JOR-1]|uniref:type IV pilin n=1 Tax=Salarchaeum sp. JOR-1 TaxID=2599399 RepID=UPI001198A749|nr:type IV pilin [Salarchaeum sp. JOR-1]QDX40659.1 type IV pilin [Salarchaeum sp. JOR-1]